MLDLTVGRELCLDIGQTSPYGVVLNANNYQQNGTIVYGTTTYGSLPATTLPYCNGYLVCTVDSPLTGAYSSSVGVGIIVSVEAGDDFTMLGASPVIAAGITACAGVVSEAAQNL